MGGQVSPVMLAKSSGAGISGRRPQARRVWARAQVDGERSYMNMRCARWGVGGDVPEVRPVARSHAGTRGLLYTINKPRTPRGRARARLYLAVCRRPVSRFGQKNGKSTAWKPSTPPGGASGRSWSRPTSGQRSACTSSPRRTPGSHAALEVGGLTVVVIAVALCLFYQKSIYLSIYLVLSLLRAMPITRATPCCAARKS